MTIIREKRMQTPIADFLQSNARDLYANFHALPIFHLKPGEKGYEKYKEVFGCKYLSLETTATGKIFDSFFYPEQEIKRAQQLAAEAFRAKDTLFGTCGTSISNLIAIDAMTREGGAILLDRESHQSMHFAVNMKKTSIYYFYSVQYCSETGRKYLKIDELLNSVRTAKDNNKPFDLVVLNACSYDGVLCNVYEVIKRINEISPETNFLIDEAWSSAFYFHPDTYRVTAGYAAEKLGNSVNIVATQSAHKSLMSMRQASMIHVFANEQIQEKLYQSRFKHHSTSPNYPILASIDLARAQMQAHGEGLVKRALLLAARFKETLRREIVLSKYLIENNQPDLEKLSSGICIEDPLKIHLNVSHTKTKGCEIQEFLYKNFGIYINRYTDDTILISIHIGINEQHVAQLLEALRALSTHKKTRLLPKFCNKDFIISYPPGVPLYAPGESMGDALDLEISSKFQSGASIFKVN